MAWICVSLEGAAKQAESAEVERLISAAFIEQDNLVPAFQEYLEGPS
jgi:hypothetical protein